MAPRLEKSKHAKNEVAGGVWETSKAAPDTQVSVTDLQDAVQGSLVQGSSSLVHQSRPDHVHRVGGQSSSQAANKTGPGEGQDHSSRNELANCSYPFINITRLEGLKMGLLQEVRVHRVPHVTRQDQVLLGDVIGW